MENNVTELWKLYESGKEYNYKLNLYTTNDRNEAFYAGDQWRGVEAKGLPTPVFNIFKRIINYFIAAIMSQKITLHFTPMDAGDQPNSELESIFKELTDLLNGHAEEITDDIDLVAMSRQVLLDAALTGDGCIYSFYNPLTERIESQTIDNVNVFFGNPNDRRINANGYPVQPYILIAFRELTDKLKEEAKYYKLPQSEIDKISSDSDWLEQSGDRGKIELQDRNSGNGKTIALLKLWNDKGKIKAIKSTRNVIIRKEWDTMLSLYPVAWMNWDQRRNSYHGQAMGTGLIPNQIYINKMFAMVMLFMQQQAFPKIVYDKTRISSWDNQIGSPIGLNGDLQGAVQILQSSTMNGQIMQTIDSAINYTKELLGATDAALGEIRPDNASAIIAITQQSAIPLENVKANLYQMIRDYGHILVDMMGAYYGRREIIVNNGGKRSLVPFDFENLKSMKLKIKVDVGASSYWSEISSMQTLDRLLEMNRITFEQYLERLPNGLIPKKNELIQQMQLQVQQQIEMQNKQLNHNYEQMAQFVQSLPPNVQAQLKSLPDKQYEEAVQQLMQGQNQMQGGGQNG